MGLRILNDLWIKLTPAIDRCGVAHQGTHFVHVLGVEIALIVRVGAHPKMGWINARREVARMANA